VTVLADEVAPSASRSSLPSLVVGLSLTDPLPGFPRYREYALVPADADGRLYWLQSVAPDGPRFLAVPAGAFFPDYAPVLPRPVCAELGLEDAADARLYCLVTVPDGDVSAATANLRAPLVVNPVTRRARQLVLTDGVHAIRAPIRR